MKQNLLFIIILLGLASSPATGQTARNELNKQQLQRSYPDHVSTVRTHEMTNLTCDTLHFPLPGTPTIWTVGAPDFGYISGNNSYGDLAKADLFEPLEDGKRLYAGLFDFAYIAMYSGEDPEIMFRVWDSTGPSGYPGEVIASATVNLSVIFDDVVNGQLTEVTFDPPVDLSGPFYLGVMLPSLEGDTLALISTDEGDVETGTAFEMWSDSSWHAFSETGGWNLDLTQAIYAVFCDVGFGAGEIATAGWSLYPNPSHDRVLIVFPEDLQETMMSLKVFDVTGKKVHAVVPDPGASQAELDVSAWPAGIYCAVLSGRDGIAANLKIVVRR